MNGEEKSENPIEEKIKDLERQVKSLEEIKIKYYFFGYIYFILTLIILFNVPNYIGDTGSAMMFITNMSIFFFTSAIIFAVIFFVEIVYKFFRLMLKAEKSS